MARMRCSLCGKTGPATPLDMESFVFNAYVRVMRGLGLSKHNGPLGVCGGCMPRYRAMAASYVNKQVLFGAAGLIAAVIYFNFTQNAAISLLIGLSLSSLCLLSYCPPLKK